jgi:hypothetical protein
VHISPKRVDSSEWTARGSSSALPLLRGDFTRTRMALPCMGEVLQHGDKQMNAQHEEAIAWGLIATVLWVVVLVIAHITEVVIARNWPF